MPAIDLPDDRMPSGQFGESDGCGRAHALHYAPIDHDGVRKRIAAITAWIAASRPALMIVDVSVEIAMLARLASVPVAYVRLAGNRDDEPHREAFRNAAALLAPFHRLLEDPATAMTVSDATFYAPGLVARPLPGVVDEHVVLGVVGKGGGVADGERWAAAARAAPAYRWRVIGPCTVPADRPGNLELLGWIGDAAAEIAAAGIVVGAAGDGLVGAVIAGRKRFVCIPEPRPFDEQTSKAVRLDDLGAAINVPTWPAPSDWPGLIERVMRLDTKALARLDDADGCARTAARLIALADGTVGRMAITA